MGVECNISHQLNGQGNMAHGVREVVLTHSAEQTGGENSKSGHLYLFLPSTAIELKMNDVHTKVNDQW